MATLPKKTGYEIEDPKNYNYDLEEYWRNRPLIVPGRITVDWDKIPKPKTTETDNAGGDGWPFTFGQTGKGTSTNTGGTGVINAGTDEPGNDKKLIVIVLFIAVAIFVAMNLA